MKIGDRIYVRGYVDEIRKDAVIVRNDGGYFGTIPSEVMGELPSAQPERLTDDDFETIRIHLNAYKEKLCNQQRWKEAEEYQHIIDRFMAFASAQPERWIPCSERLPEKDGEYYVTLENGCVKILGYATVQTLRYPKGFYYVTDDGIAWRQKMNPVIAWMPLPAPYREEGER